MAVGVADALHRQPSAFAWFARAFSEDETSRNDGGSLCGTRASQLAPQILDALQELPVGVISDVVETNYGFHVLTRSQPPEPEMVAGQRVLLRYHGASTNNPELWIRTRTEAMRIADEVRADASAFDRLVRLHSESDDKWRDGDIGVWSTDAPDQNGCELHELSKLRVGEISRPIDTAHGIVLLKRTEVTPRATYAAAAIRLYYNPFNEAEKTEAHDLINQLQQHLLVNPSLLSSYQEQYCCSGEITWSEGRGSPLLEAVVSGLQAGERSSEPLDLGDSYAIVERRAMADSRTARVLQYELPNPERADTTGLLVSSSGPVLARKIEEFRAQARHVLELPEEEQNQLDEILTLLVQSLGRATEPAARLKARETAQVAIANTLDPATQRKFRALLDNWIASEVIAVRRQ